MKLNLAIIAHHLSELNPHLCGETDQKLTLSDIRLLTPQSQLSPKSVYLYKWDGSVSLPLLPKMQICIGGNDEACALLQQNNVNGIVLNTDMDIMTVFECIQDIFLHFNSLDSQLMEAIILDEPIGTLLNICAKFFDNPVIIVDASLSLIDLSTNYPYPEDSEDWQSMISTGTSSISLMNELKKRELTLILNTSLKALFIELGSQYPPYINVNFFDDQDERIASLVIIQAHSTLSAWQLGLADFVASKLNKKVLNHLHTTVHKRTLLVECIEKIIQAEQVDESLVISSLSHLGWDVHNDYLLLRIVLSQKSFRNGTVEHSKNNYSSLFSDCLTLSLANTFVIIVQRRGSEKTSKAFSLLQEQLAIDEARCGVSLPFCDFMLLREQYELAGVALEHGNSSSPLHHYEDIMAEHLLSEISKFRSLHSLCHSEVIKLHEYDQKKDGCLVYTLQLYLQHERSLKAAANELHIHRNTLVYRLNQIKKYANLNFADPQSRNHIFLTCLILQYLHQLNSE